MTAERPAFGAELRRRTVILDGGLSTQLERAGHDLSTLLWSAKLLVEQPDAIRLAHAAYFAAGAEVAITSSYQASAQGFATIGIDAAGTAHLLGRSADLAGQARDEAESTDGRPRWVAASVGPYGAVLGDGAEYRGDCGLTVQQFQHWHRPRLQILMDLVAEGRADLLAIETVPSSAEAEAILAELAGSGIPSWLSFTAANGRTRTGEPLADALALADGIDDIVAVGVNCCEPEQVPVLAAAQLKPGAAADPKPLVAYPHTGQRWDAVKRSWTGASARLADQVVPWMAVGIAGIGGCCQVTADDIAAIAADVSTLGKGFTP